MPEGCEEDEDDDEDGDDHPVKAITTGAGVNCGAAYAFPEANNVTIICGYSKTAGISGGWVQGGGHSVMSPVYGLGADRVLQFKIVAPDGEYRVANKYQNQDLFWALQGGGGNTFGIVLESIHRVEENLPLIVSNLTLPPTKPGPIFETMKLLIDDAARWGELGWGGQIIHNQFFYVNPKLFLAQAKDSMKTVAEYIVSQGGSAQFTELDTFHEFVHQYISQYKATAGRTIFTVSRLISKTATQSKVGRSQLKQVLEEYIVQGGGVYTSVDVPTIFQHEANSTAVTPGWYKSVWHFHPVFYWAWNSTLQERKWVVQRMNAMNKKLKEIPPDTGSYINEASPFTPDWKQAYWWMENYKKLLQIKQRYDPHRLLRGWRNAGWEDSDERGSCLEELAKVGTD